MTTKQEALDRIGEVIARADRERRGLSEEWRITQAAREQAKSESTLRAFLAIRAILQQVAEEQR